MKEQEKKEIGSATYEVTQLKASKGLRMFTQLTKILGPALGQLASGKTGGGVMDMTIDSSSFSGAMELLAQNLDSEVVEGIVKELSEVTRVDTGGGGFVPLSGVYELHFRGKIKQLLGWLKFALEVNFSDFFELLDANATE